MMPFASAALLLWGLAAAIPVVIHLWSRRRHDDHAWAAMAFLMAAVRRHARRARFQEWLLLALRIAVLVLFALALADPRSDKQAGAVFPLAVGEPTHHLLVIDASYSMDLRHGDRTSLDRARDAALELVRAAPQGDGFSLVLLADPPSAVLGEPVFDTSAVTQELMALRATPGGADLPATLARVRELLARTRQTVPRLTRRHVAVYSDMARNTWEPGQQPSSDWRRQWEELATTARVDLHDVGPRTAAEIANVAITALRCSAAATDTATAADAATARSAAGAGPALHHSVHVGGEARLEAVLRNYGERVAKVTVEFQLDGRPLAAPAVEVPPRGEALAAASVRLDTPGERVASAMLRAGQPPDALSWDNQRWLVVPVRERIEVLCVEGGLDEARFLALAIAPDGRGSASASDAPALRVAIASETALLDRPLQRYDLVALCNVARVSDSESDALRQFVIRGGRLVIFLGDRVDAANYNDRLGSVANRVLPARLAPAIAQDELRIDPRGYRDPLVAMFRGQERAGLLSTPIWSYMPATVVAPESARVALAFHTGDPWIVSESVGAGQVWLVTTPAAPRSRITGSNPPRPWNAWATWPSFVPLMQTLLREALSGRAAVRNTLVGESLVGAFPLDPHSVPATVLVDCPAVGAEPPETLRIAAERTGQELRWLLPDTRWPGIYVVRPDQTVLGAGVAPPPANEPPTDPSLPNAANGDKSPSGNGAATAGAEQRFAEQRFAVNVDSHESDPQRIDADDLPAGLREASLAAEQVAPSPGRDIRSVTGSDGNVSSDANGGETGRTTGGEAGDEAPPADNQRSAKASDSDGSLRESGSRAERSAESVQRRWFRMLLAAVAVALAAESWMAWRLGRRGGA